jgi:CRISPR-associated protein Cas5t
MNAFRIHVKGWIASFRYPVFIAGFQPSVPVPPLSTVYGILSAAKGEIVTPWDVKVGYVFVSNGFCVDLETIYELDAPPLTAKSNICKRQILFEPDLYLYLSDKEYAEAFRIPHYPLLMGRSSELAMVEEIKEIFLPEQTDVRLGGTIVPFPSDGVYGPLQALPTHFLNEIPRKARGTRAYYVIKDFIKYSAGSLPYDEEKQWGIWWHG